MEYSFDFNIYVFRLVKHCCMLILQSSLYLHTSAGNVLASLVHGSYTREEQGVMN